MQSILHHELIKARLRILGSSLSCIAKELGVSRSSVVPAVKGRSTSLRVDEAVAEKLGVSVDDLFPGRHQRPPRKAKNDAVKRN